MAVRVVRLIHADLLQIANFPDRLANGACFGAADFWLESIQMAPERPAEERIDELRRFRTLIATRQMRAHEVADGSAKSAHSTLANRPSWHRHTVRSANLWYDENQPAIPVTNLNQIEQEVCRLVLDNLPGVVLSLRHKSGEGHAVAGFGLSGQHYHFFDPNFGEVVADTAFEIHHYISHIVSNALPHAYKKSVSIVALPRTLSGSDIH